MTCWQLPKKIKIKVIIKIVVSKNAVEWGSKIAAVRSDDVAR
jgi:hypothetical protein